MRSLMRKWVAFVLGGSGVAHPWVGSFRLRLQRLCWSVLETAFVWMMSSCAGCIGIGIPYRRCLITAS